MPHSSTASFSWPEVTALRRRRSVKWTEFGPDVLPMRIAEMDTPLAEPIATALTRAIARSDTGYATRGDLPASFAQFAAQRYGWRPDASATRLVVDVMTGIVEVLRMTTRPGDTVALVGPAYPPYFSQVARLGLRVVTVPLIAEGGRHRLDIDRLEHEFAAGTRVLLLCNPHNPTGTVFAREELTAVAEAATTHGVQVVTDEIFAPMVFPGGHHVPFPSLDPPAAARAISLVSASKAWNLAGFKAALIVPGPAAAATVAALDAELDDGVGLFGVLASEVAFAEGTPWLDRVIGALDENRRLLAQQVERALPDVSYRPPDAGFTAWLDFGSYHLTEDVAELLLDRARVGVASGARFNPHAQPGQAGSGHGFVRLNFATRPDVIRTAVRRMAAAVQPH